MASRGTVTTAAVELSSDEASEMRASTEPDSGRQTSSRRAATALSTCRWRSHNDVCRS
jgi:hypothetical protein